MRQYSLDDLKDLLGDFEPPCISLYQPTHRHHPYNQQDPIRFRNLLVSIERSLAERYAQSDIATLLDPFRSIANDTGFWIHRTDGLAILASPDRFRLFELQRPVEELAVVADSFHVKPLLRIVQSADRYQILCVSRQQAKLYEGNRDALDPVDLTGIPTTITEALGEELTEPHLTVASYGGAGKGGKEMRHGQGSKKDEIDIDIERFFRVIDRAILEHHSRPANLPLLLAALPEYHAPFRSVSHNPLLVDGGIQGNPFAMTADELRAQAWQILEPAYLGRLARFVEAFGVAQSRNQGALDVGQVARAAAEGRIATLLLEADRTIPGRYDVVTGEIEMCDLSDPTVDDILDDIAEAVLRTKGEVILVPRERMPGTTGLAAIYRF